MQFSIVTILLSIATITSAAVADVEGVRNIPRDSILISRQNAGRPVPTGNCCIASTSVKQDTCTTAAGATGRCVPGGQACGGSLSCVAQTNLECDASIIERGNPLCRAKLANGNLQDGAKVITSLSQAKVN